jgi:hypothetical protein
MSVAKCEVTRSLLEFVKHAVQTFHNSADARNREIIVSKKYTTGVWMGKGSRGLCIMFFEEEIDY